MIDSKKMNVGINSKGIKISPNFHEKDWNDLKLDTNNQEDWKKAIEIFKDRIDGRYFKQIEIMDLNPDRKIGTYAGFSIMSIVCLLIETLEQFWNGNIETSRNNNNANGLISNDSLAFHSFFQRNKILSSFFDSKEKANIFYLKIRCGLLHQGQTKGKSLIHIRSNEPILSWLNPNNIEDGISINRRKFVKEVKKVYEDYIEHIENANLNERKRIFKRKMDYIVNK